MSADQYPAMVWPMFLYCLDPAMVWPMFLYCLDPAMVWPVFLYCLVEFRTFPTSNFSNPFSPSFLNLTLLKPSPSQLAACRGFSKISKLDFWRIFQTFFLNIYTIEVASMSNFYMQKYRRILEFLKTAPFSFGSSKPLAYLDSEPNQGA